MCFKTGWGTRAGIGDPAKATAAASNIYPTSAEEKTGSVGPGRDITNTNLSSPYGIRQGPGEIYSYERTGYV